MEYLNFATERSEISYKMNTPSPTTALLMAQSVHFPAEFHDATDAKPEIQRMV